MLTTEQLIEFDTATNAILDAAAKAGDVASVIIAQAKLDDTKFVSLARPCIEAAQNHNIAAIVAGDPRLANRMGADGIQFGQNADDIAEAVERYSPKIIVGAGNVRTRHHALVIGELQPDYVMFGKPGGDTHAEPHPKNLGLGEWWSSMVEIPCIVVGGKRLESVVAVADTGVEFIALGAAIFAPNGDGNARTDIEETVATRVKRANELLDQHAPIFEDVEA